MVKATSVLCSVIASGIAYRLQGSPLLQWPNHEVTKGRMELEGGKIGPNSKRQLS